MRDIAITITIDSADVATLREIFHLALVQSEAVLDDCTTPEDSRDAFAAHSVTCQLMAHIDAMLPDSTGFFA